MIPIDRLNEPIDKLPHVSDFLGLGSNLIRQQKGQLGACAHQCLPQLILRFHLLLRNYASVDWQARGYNSSTVGIRLSKIQCVSEPSAEHQPHNDHDEHETHKAHSPVPIVTAAVSIKPAAAEQQNQNDN